ncbi:hypothetical protein [Leptolinea tardivitalis]|uniref:Uncharacterized protein n=1 Tax=Leptolinea tardivitalis TaxID=229920 RepID=A0A0P6X5T1_9CHLR|nr:hypothetical protein [Leptolinea tardivitalis]KPL70269.1 hypothetical protein ADM99_13950 [Leptolinea tardivitalis]
MGQYATGGVFFLIAVPVLKYTPTSTVSQKNNGFFEPPEIKGLRSPGLDKPLISILGNNLV